MDGLEAEVGHGLVDGVDAGAAERVAEAVPGLLGGGAEFAPVWRHDVLVGAEVEGQKPLWSSEREWRRYSRPETVSL